MPDSRGSTSGAKLASRLPVRSSHGAARPASSYEGTSLSSIPFGTATSGKAPATAASATTAAIHSNDTSASSTITTTTTAAAAAVDTPYANRSSILDHTHAANRSVVLGQMSPVAAESSRSAASHLRANLQGDDAATVQEMGSRMSVRRKAGQRAESDSVAGSRRSTKQLARQVSVSHAHPAAAASAKATVAAAQASARSKEDDAISSNLSARSSTSSRAPFATVRKIFRSRSKSQAASPRAANGPSTINEIVEELAPSSSNAREKAAAVEIGSPADRSSSPRRASRDSGFKHSSFFNFGRARTPPRTKVEWEGVDSQSLASSSFGSRSVSRHADMEGKSREIPFQLPTMHESNSPLGLPSSSSEGTTADMFGGTVSSSGAMATSSSLQGIDRRDRKLTLQALQPASPYGTRRSSLTASPSLTPKRGTMDLPREVLRDKQTPTPTNAQMQSLYRSQAQSGDGASTSLRTNSSVPKMWQISRNSRSSLSEDSPTHDSMLAKQRYGSSATSGSAASFRTAPSFRDGSTPDVAPLTLYGNMFESGASIPRSATSPLSDLIESLEQRISASTTPTPSSAHRSQTFSERTAEARRPNAAARASPTPNGSINFPSSETGWQEEQRDESTAGDEDEGNFSRSSTPHMAQATPKRNTFGAGELFNPTAADSGTPLETQQDGTTPSRRDVSMYDIENSLAAVEAALHDHSVAGSLDPNPLRHHIILSPRHAGDVSTANLSLFEGSSVHLDDTDDRTPGVSPSSAQFAVAAAQEEQERLARVTLPREQQNAIADAVRQVRRAISSSQLPQIPNEDDSDVSRSSVVHAAHGLDAYTPSVATRGRAYSSTQQQHMQQQHLAGGAEEGQGQTLTLQRQRSSASRESTPMRAARIRQESMQDVEQAYARMVDLVTSAAGLDLIPSPMPATRFFTRRPTQSQPSPVTALPSASSPLANTTHYEPRSSATSYVSTGSPSHDKQRSVRERTQSAAPTPSAYHVMPSVLRPLPVPPPLPPSVATSSRSARQQLLRESDALSRFAAAPLPDLSEEASENTSGLRGRSSNVSLGSRSSRRAASESPPRYFQRGAPSSMQQQQDRNRNGAAANKRNSVDVYAARTSSSGGGTASGTSPSVTVKTQGTPRIADVDHYEMPVGAASTAASMANGMAMVAAHNRSNSQQTYDWQSRSRFSSPSSTRLTQQEQQSKRMSTGSTESAAAITAKRQLDEHIQRRVRAAQLSYGGSGHHSPGVGSGSGSYHRDSGGADSYRRSGSIRDWGGRLDDVSGSAHRPPSGASGSHQTFGSMTRAHAQRGAEGVSSDASEAARLAFLQSRISSPTSSLTAMQRRHALERDSLLDMLDRTRSDAIEGRARNEQLQVDLHLEVTRVLELERELQRRREREDDLATRVEALEEELKAEQADRVRLGEQLERVQRAVDEAAQTRRMGRRNQYGDASEDVGDETMEVVEGGDQLYSRETTGDEEYEKRGSATSPTCSSVSILQEDLLPIKRRVFDVTRAEDEARMTGRSISGLPDLQEVSHSSERNLVMDAMAYRQGDESDDDNIHEVKRSPSLHSYPSALGLDVNDQELRWNLDEESPPELREVSPPEQTVNAHGRVQREYGDDDDEADDSGSFSMHPHPANVTATARDRLASSDDGNADRSRLPSGLSKRMSLPPQQTSPSRLPVLSPKPSARTSGLSTSTSATTTIAPSTSTSSSIEGKRRFPSAMPTMARANLAERLGSSMHNAAKLMNGSADSSYDESPPTASPPASVRYVSHASRTTGGDTSYTAQTVSPIGSFIATFPTMTSGVRKSSVSAPRVDGAVAMSGAPGSRIQSPVAPQSPHRVTSAATKVPLSAAMRSGGGYYDTRRPAGYDPVDVSVLDALSAEDSSTSFSQGHRS